jgi:hypothetical protein
MRRKKSSKKRSVRRRRSSMGAMGGGLNNVLGIVAGAAIGRIVANKLLPNVDSKIKNAGVAVLGAFGMPKLIKGAFGTSIGAGMVAAGGIGLLSDFGVVGAIEDTLSLPLTVGQVEDGISVIAGDDSVMAGDMSVIAGIEEEDDDYNY